MKKAKAVAATAKASEDETVPMSKQFIERLWGAVADGIGLSERDKEAMLKHMLKHGTLIVPQDTADNLVHAAMGHSGRHFSSGVGYLFNKPEMTGHGRHGGCHTFTQICRTVTG